MKLINMELLVLVVAAMAATPVYATSSASASLDNLTVSLYSWMPSVTPTITWSNSNYNYVNVSAYDYANANYPSDYQYGPGALSASVSTAISQASGSVSNSLGNSPYTNVSVAGSASGGAGSQQGYFQGYSYGSNSSFTLSADTLAIFSATGSTNATTTVGYDPLTGNYEYGASGAQFTASGDIGNSHQYANDSLFSSAYYNSTYDPITNSYIYSGMQDNKTGLLSVSFVNSTGSSATGYLTAYTSAYGYSTVPVPEPETYAMMLAGLGLVGFMVRRRKGEQEEAGLFPV